MHVLITGGNGFIGSHLVRALEARGHAVRSLVQPGTPLDNLRGTAAEAFPGDLLDADSLRAACAGAEVVLHLAAKVSDVGRAEDFRRVNVEGTRALLETAIGAGARRLVLVSSVAVHRYRGFTAADEETPRDGGGDLPYAASKIAAEDLLTAARDRIEGVIVRPGVFPFGPRDRLATAPILDAIASGKFAVVRGGRALVRTAYAENLAAGLALAATHPAAAGRTYVIADAAPVSWRALWDQFAAAMGTRPPRWSVPYPLAWTAAAAVELGARAIGRPPPLTRYRVNLSARDCDFTIARAAAELGYVPAIAMDEAIRRTVAWWREERKR